MRALIVTVVVVLVVALALGSTYFGRRNEIVTKQETIRASWSQVDVAIERRADSGFAHIVLEPAARADAVRHVLVLQPLAAQLPPRPAAEPASAARPARGSGARR